MTKLKVSYCKMYKIVVKNEKGEVIEDVRGMLKNNDVGREVNIISLEEQYPELKEELESIRYQ